jgi:hypothetical protein
MNADVESPSRTQAHPMPPPRILRAPQPRLLVDGEPFLILGLQWDCNSCYSADEMVPLFIAEAASGPHGRAERNVFYALGVHQAIGFDPWAIDRAYPDWFAPSIVRRHDLTWSKAAYDLRDSYVAIARALRPLARAQGIDCLATFVQEEGEIGTAFGLGGVDFRVRYEHPEGLGRGCVIVEEDGRHFLVIGSGFRIRPYTPAPESRSLPLRQLDRGHFLGDRWVATATVTQETARGDAVIPVVEGSVHRFALSVR